MSDIGFDGYQAGAARTAPDDEGEKTLAVLALGVAGEAGEVAELIKKHVGHGHPLDKEKLTKELGDVLWYLATLAEVLGISFQDVADMNLEKLKKRYPDGFSHEASLGRKE